jgi:hypothetical protein
MRTQTWSDQNVGHDGAPIMRGYNELSFEDTEEQEEFLIQAQKNHTTIVKNSETRDIGGGNETPPGNLHGGAKLPEGVRTTKILTEDMLSVGKHFKVKVGKPEKAPEGAGIEIIEEEDGTRSILLSTGTGGASILIKKDSIFLNANKEIHAHAKGKWHMSSHGESSEIVIENANGNIKMQTANGDIKVQSDGGHKVLINCESPDVHETEIKINGNLGHLGPGGTVVPEKTEHYDTADKPKPGKEIKWPWWPAQLPPEAPKPTPLIEAKMPGGGEQPEGSVDDD